MTRQELIDLPEGIYSIGSEKSKYELKKQTNEFGLSYSLSCVDQFDKNHVLLLPTNEPHIFDGSTAICGCLTIGDIGIYCELNIDKIKIISKK